MNCDRLRELLFDHVDGLLGRDEAEGARDHLAACGDCRALQEEVRRNFSALDAWEEEALPAGSFERLDARMAAVASAPAPAPAPAPARRRSWVRLAVPYAAGLATAAALALVFLVPSGPGLPSLSPGPGPGSPPATDGALARVSADRAADTPAPRAFFAGGGGSRAAAAGSVRAGERPLEFRDADRGVLRKFLLPPGVDPGKVMLVDTPPRILPDDEGVR